MFTELCEQIDIREDQSQPLTPTTNDCEILENFVSRSHRKEQIDTNISIKPDVGSEGSAENEYFTNKVLGLKATDSLLGTCIDSATQKIVFEERHKQGYCDFANFPFELRMDSHPQTFNFWTHEHLPLVPIPYESLVLKSHFIELVVEVVDVQIPFLLSQ